MKDTDMVGLKRAMTLLFLIVSVAFIWETYTNSQLVPAEGTIMARRDVQRGALEYVIRYSVQGQQREQEVRLSVIYQSTSSGQKSIGDSISILVNPERPTQPKLDSAMGRYGLTLMLLLLFPITFILAISK